MNCELELPWPPNVNHYKKPGALVKTKGGKLYQTRINTAETNKFLFDVWRIIYRKRQQDGLKSFGGAKISVVVDAYPPDARKRDLDGILKVLLDSMMHAKLFDDDSQISRLFIQRLSIIPKGKVVVRIQTLEEVKS